MKYFLLITTVTALIVIGAINAMAIEEAEYTVIKKDTPFEIRDYAAHIIAETVVEGNLKEAGNIAFKKLFRYISGDNRSRDKVSMTAPVSQKPEGEKIKMTAPVAQQRDKESWVVSFMMPSSFTIETLPEPEDIEITLRQVPARRVAAIRYSGFWSEKGYLRHKAELESWINRMGFTVVGVPIWARYNPPFMPWFLRRNEVLIPIDAGTD
ncbi:MAG: heme-binding protein [Desulfotignum sp.]|nr:heme-binding protein [Desulfotignum sp.]